MKIKSLIVGLSISFISLLFCFIVGEIYFRNFFIQSDGFGVTLASRKWFSKYWKPINSFGYRDNEWIQEELQNKKVVLVIGDSFVAGYGIENIRDRFSNVLGSYLGDEYVTINVSRNGWGTRGELAALKGCPFKVDTVVWSYFPNDIQDAARSVGRVQPYSDINPKGILGLLTSNSHLFNFLYWRFSRLGLLGQSNIYINWLFEQFNDEKVWNIHKAELEYVNSLTKNMGAKLFVVIFPFLFKTEECKLMTDKVKSVFEDLHIPVLDVSEILPNMKKKDIIVNKMDYHPSVFLHRKIGEELYKLYFSSRDRNTAFQ